MLNTMKNNKKKAAIGFGLTASAALVAGMVQTPEADALVGGKEVGNTYGKYGIGWDSTYTIPLKSGGEVEGFCLDPYQAAPKQAPAAQYGNPEPYDVSKLSAGDKNRLMVALYVGKIAIEQDAQFNQFKSVINQARPIAKTAGINLPNVNGWNKDTVAAASSVIVHQVGSKGPEGNNRWQGGDRYLKDPKAKSAYNEMNQLAGQIGQLQKTPVIGKWVNDNILNVKFTQRKPSDWGGPNKGHQRMIAMTDIKIPEFKIPNIPNLDLDIPKPSDKPSRTPNNSTKSKSTTPSSKTPSVSTTPSTTPSVPSEETTTPSTPSSTSTTSSKKTTPKPDISIRTSAGTKEENVVEKGKTIIDTVSYEGLEKGKKYKLKGELVNKETGEKTGDAGETEFTAEKSKGEQDVEIKIENPESDELVVFEQLIDDKTDKVVAKHEDKEDKAQTIGKPEYTPEIRTQAESSTGNLIQTGTTVTDTVSYTGLEPGKSYRLEARLMCKEDGTDTGASQSKTFTAEETDGTVNVENIAVTNPDCTEQVVFERLYDEETGELVAVHEDITDAAQTVGGPRSEMLKKKKKKVAPAEEKVTPTPEKEAPAPTPNIHQEQNQNQSAPGAPAAPAPAGGGAPGGSAAAPGGAASAAPRQVISAVPSGNITHNDNDTFNRI